MQQATSSQHIDENIKKIEILIGNVCDPLFSKNTFSDTNEACTHVNTSQRPWFDDECQESRKLFYFELNNYRRNKTTENRV